VQEAGGRPLLLIEDDSATNRRNHIVGVADAAKTAITLTLHEVTDVPRKLHSRTYAPNALAQNGRASLTKKLLASHLASRSIVAAGTRFGANGLIRRVLHDFGASFVLEITPGDYRRLARVQRRALLKRGTTWSEISLDHPVTQKSSLQRIAELDRLNIDGYEYSVVAFQFGRVDDRRHQTRIALLSDTHISHFDAARALAWIRWIHPMRRRANRAVAKRPRQASMSGSLGILQVRSNIQLARQHDENAFSLLPPRLKLRHQLVSERKILNTVELFAGAGGMGLGLLMSEAPFRIIASAEVHPIYAATLSCNYEWIARRGNGCADRVPEEIRPIDLRDTTSISAIEHMARCAGGVDVVVGGPPCQGFSNANRNSWSSANPHNELLDVFFRYVRRLNPAVFVMENVQGILWTRNRKTHKSAIEQLADRATRNGYRIYPKLLDAVWYGVPQFRSRFFLLGLHRDLGYSDADFGEWGPFPYPTHGPGTSAANVTVADAIRDLPRIANGQQTVEMEYHTPARANSFLDMMRRWAQPDVVTDHIASRHAAYVIDRYRRIPTGGNWSDIRAELTNYADVERTHSNIYRRLSWREPSVTIGHYRKSMLVHPSQHRGLSLREASRLQSFPDWFRFAGAEEGPNACGLVYKQQQLANAVCPLVMKAIADFVAQL
jgi:DNA-cytosine methyltransferase